MLPVFGWALFCGGSLSNLLDRVMSRSVLDFVSFGVGPLSPFIFNLADIAIGLGLAIFSLGVLYDVGKSAVQRRTNTAGQ